MSTSKVNAKRITTTVYLVLTAAVISVGPATNSRASAESIELPHVEISNWAIRFGAQMWEIGKQVTRIREIRERYQADAKIEKVDGLALVKEMSEELENMMGDKIEAIKRIMDASEQLSMPHHPEVFERGQRVDYYNAKRLNEYQKSGANTGELMKEHKALMMTNSRHYGNVGINTSVSAVHVPTNVFDGGPDVMNGILWSEQLDRIFISNYESDPSLTWQFFGSSTGFMRQFPATKWGQGEWEPDLYDCRLRPWYLQAASSPKDMIILVDTSGSMTGVRKEIAKHVVLTLLDTLSENDFINIYKFSETPIPVVPCFKDKLVHANLENLRELRHGMIETETSDIANFTLAFTAAFEILAKYNRTNQGTQCNQAIMLVTDGAPSGYREVFEKFNWPHKPVRVFSYVIGREIIDTTATNWMACTNKGYFARVTSLAEVREQVLKYIPVLSRPMVMYQKEHPIVWTSSYVDVASRTKPKYRMVISVATPVYDRKNFTVRTANLLGVAGTDIPVAEVKKRTPAYKLGVNGYAFMVNNNGFVVFHPDHRPLDQDEILKPNYNSVDLSEVELVDSDAGPRDNDTTLMTMRREMIEKKESETTMRVKIHYDGMRRASIRRQRYYYRGLKGTPFSLGLALPEGYGHFRVVTETEVKRLMADHNINVSSFFTGKNWKVHPNWVYCRYNYDTIKSFDTPEAEVLHFVDRTQRERWRWNSKHPRPSPDGSRSHKQDDNYYCDKHLMQSLIFDAQATGVFDKNISQSLDRQDPHAMFKLFGISVAFVATRSGLVRWQDINTIDDKHFSETNIHAIDQTWYKRAVDQYLVEPESFVYSVPFGVSPGMVNETVVTASHAIFVEKDGYRAPAAVVGLQYKNSAFRETFFNITSGCTGGMPCKRTCGDSGDLACYVLDNNGYVVISKEERDMSRFFGEIDWLVMDSLIHYGVFKKIRVYDYQAVCKDQIGHKSAANFLLTPFRYAKWIVHWMMGRASWMLLQTQLAHWINPDWAWSMEQQQQSEYQEEDEVHTDETPSASPGEVVDGEISINQQDEPVTMENAYANKTRQRPCDRQTDLYTLQPEKLFKGGKADSVKGKHNCNSNSFSTRQCERHYSTHKIPHSNLLLVVIDTSCKCDTQKRRIDSEEVKLNNETDVCNRPQDNLFRLRPTTCISYHPEEEEIKQCGGASLALPSLLLAIISLIFSILRSV